MYKELESGLILELHQSLLITLDLWKIDLVGHYQLVSKHKFALRWRKRESAKLTIAQKGIGYIITLVNFYNTDITSTKKQNWENMLKISKQILKILVIYFMC
jgi:hypothetical protein